MSSPASIGKHPIHPMLVEFPIGLWVFALVCDVVRLFGGAEVWNSVALYCIAGGIVGALLAAVPGQVQPVPFIDTSARPGGTVSVTVTGP